MSVSLQQPMRPAEIELVELANKNETTIKQEITDRKTANATLQENITALTNTDSELQTSIDEINAKFPVATKNIADGAVISDKIMDGTINTTDLNEGIQNQLSFLASVPDFEFGTSNSFNVSANSYTEVTITFTTKTEEPIVLCGLQHTTGNLTCIVTGVTNQQFAARIYNLSSTDVTGVTLDWLTISGR